MKKLTHPIVNKEILAAIGLMPDGEKKEAAKTSLQQLMGDKKPALDKLKAKVGGSNGEMAKELKDSGRPTNGSGRGRGLTLAKEDNANG